MQMNKAMIQAGVLALALTGAMAQEVVVAYDNGGLGYDWGHCISGPNQCGTMNGTSFTLYNAFTLTEPTHVVGFQNWNGTGLASTYLSTNWSFWSDSPNHVQTPLYAGSSVATIDVDQGFNRAQVLDLDIDLPAGTYWFGLNHQTTQPWTYVVPSTWVNGAVLGDGTGWFLDNTGQMAFQILASSAVPEPSNALLFPLGFAALWLRRKSRQPVQAQVQVQA